MLKGEVDAAQRIISGITFGECKSPVEKAEALLVWVWAGAMTIAFVMRGLDPRIHGLKSALCWRCVDGRDEPAMR